MKNKTIYRIGGCLLFLLSACMHEQDVTIQSFALPEGTSGIQFALKAADQDGAAEAGDHDATAYNGSELNENEIDNIAVYFFDPADGSLVWHVPPGNIHRDNATATLVVHKEVKEKIWAKEFDVVVVANFEGDPPAITSYDELKEQAGNVTYVNTGKPRTKFLMDGAIASGTIVWDTQSHIYKISETVMLKRAAAKIRFRLKEIQSISEDNVLYEVAAPPKVKLVHYATKTSLIEGKPYEKTAEEWETDDFLQMRRMTLPDEVGGGTYYTTGLPLYSYENDWHNHAENETFLMVQIDFKSGGHAPKAYYYRIPVNYRLPLPGMSDEEKAGLHQLQRNHLYDIASSITILGNEDESEPLAVEAAVTVQPWNEWGGDVDGSMQNAHYLEVRELHATMIAASRDIVYLSNLPVKITIDRTVYEYYNEMGQKMIVEETSGFQSDMVIDTVAAGEKVLRVQHPLPENYVPLEIFFTVTQVLPEGEIGLPLFQRVHVTQYPQKYVTGTSSVGLKGGTSKDAGGNDIEADFRFHDPLGVNNFYQGGGYGPQRNNVLYKVTTLVNKAGERIGDPTDERGFTKTDAVSNQLISPEFIIASQHGLYNSNTRQYEGESVSGWEGEEFGNYYGPFSPRFADRWPYFNPGFQSYQPLVQSADYAYDRCYNYFEDEYGTDGWYREYFEYLDTDWFGDAVVEKGSREVYKTFTYKGRWRIPTAAELAYINGIQDDQNSAVKYLLFGEFYWTAEYGKAYNMKGNKLIDNPNNSGWPNYEARAAIRCVFDTYKLENHE